MRGVTSLRSREVLDPNESIRHAVVLVIGSDGRVLHFAQWQRAVQLVTEGQAYVIQTVKRRNADGTVSDAMLRSPSSAVALPLIVQLMPHIYIPSVAFIHAKTEMAGRLAILRRDKRVCTYCGGKRGRGNTIDHIYPKSRGGRNTWQNLVAACQPCNTDKGSRTPEEAGMTMLFDPRVSEGGIEDLQAEVWSYIDACAGVSV